MRMMSQRQQLAYGDMAIGDMATGCTALVTVTFTIFCSLCITRTDFMVITLQIKTFTVIYE